MKRRIATVAAALLSFAAALAGDTTDEQALRTKLRAFIAAKPGFQLPSYSAKLDSAYDRADWRAFNLAFNEAYGSIKNTYDLAQMMNWELYRVYDGGGYVIARFYAIDSWNLALSLEKKAGQTKAAEMKVRGLANALYVFALIAADSPMCKDMSAPYNRMQEFRYTAKDVIRFGHSLSPDDRERAIDFAVRQEKLIAPLRERDDALCRGGNDESMALMRAAKDSPEKMKEGPPDPLRPGKTYIVEVAGEFHPQYKPVEEWKRTRDEVRPTLPKQLQQLLDAAP